MRVMIAVAMSIDIDHVQEGKGEERDLQDDIDQEVEAGDDDLDPPVLVLEVVVDIKNFISFIIIFIFYIYYFYILFYFYFILFLFYFILFYFILLFLYFILLYIIFLFSYSIFYYYRYILFFNKILSNKFIIKTKN